MRKSLILLFFVIIWSCAPVPEPWKSPQPVGDFYLADSWDVQSNLIAMLIISNNAGIDQWASRTTTTTNIVLQQFPGEELEFIRVSFPDPYYDENIRRLTLYYYHSEPKTNKFLVKIIAEMVPGTDIKELFSTQTNLTNLGSTSETEQGDITNRYYLQRRESQINIESAYYLKGGEYLYPTITYDYQDFLGYLKELETNTVIIPDNE